MDAGREREGGVEREGGRERREAMWVRTG